MSIQAYLQLLVAGVAMGFIYCLVAIEYTLIWNSTGLVNFAHERFIVLGAFFFGDLTLSYFTDNFIISIAITLALMAAYGIIVSIIVINPLRNLPSTLFSVMGMLMVGYIMREAIRLIFGAKPYTIRGFFSGTVKIGGIVFSKVYFVIIGVALILLLIQWLFMTKTKIGKATLCVAQDKEAAALMGINVKKNIAITVAISSVICGVIGILVIPLLSVSHTMASVISLKGFAAGVVGGFGSYTGALVGGLLIGILENLYLAVGPSAYKDVVAFIVLILILMLKPAGIMIKSERRAHRKTLGKGAHNK